MAIGLRPYVQNVRRTAATIRWTTPNAGEAAVLYRGADGIERVVRGQSVARSPDETGLSYTYYKHQVVINGLSPGTEYAYRVRLDNSLYEPGVEMRFRTSGPSGFTFLAIGDTGTGSAEQDLLAKRMEGEAAQLLVHTGDVVYPTGRYDTYEKRYFDYYHALMSRVPFYPTPGNHDYYETRAEPYINIHDVPVENVPERDRGRYYSFDWGDVHFISLDSNDPLIYAAAGPGEMLSWLEKDLAETKKFWRIAFFHHPPFAFGQNDRDLESVLARQHIVPILERYGVPLVLNGHEHSYQRSHPLNRTVYVTTGGGGAPLYGVRSSSLLATSASKYHYVRASVEGRRLTLRAIDRNGELFDEATINPQPLLGRKSVVNAASFTETVGKGAVVSIFGWQMAVETLDDGGKPLGLAKRSGVQVNIGDVELALLMVSPTQVNAVLPPHLSGPATIRVSTPGGSASADIEINPVAPALFNAVLDASGSLVTQESPALAGSALTVLATGLAGFNGSINVRVGGQVLEAFESPAPTPGIQVIRFELPASTDAGLHFLQVEAGGVASNIIYIAVR